MRISQLKIYVAMALITLAVCSCHKNSISQNPERYPVFWQKIISEHTVPIYDYAILETYPHDKNAFTEGFLIEDGEVYESSGLYQASSLRRTNLQTGELLQSYALPPNYFAEGITLLNDRIYQLTYESNTGFIYNKTTLKQEQVFHYPTQGWGLTTDGRQLIISDGSAALTFLDPLTSQITNYVIVTLNNQPVGFLNSLCFVNGKIYANIWAEDVIAIIAPKDGKIEGLIDLSRLNPHLSSPESVLNGIAYNKKDNALYVTGKNWPHIYEIKLLPK